MLVAKHTRALLPGVLAVLFALPAVAQWQDRTIVLNPGWNAVFLDEQPEKNAPVDLFEGLPVDSVFLRFKQKTSTALFLKYPEALVPARPEWLTYIPEGQPGNHKTDLFALFAGNCCLIKLAGDEPVNWVIKGQPRLKPPQWGADSYNLVGFHVDPAAAPTFGDFFAPSEAHAGQPVYRLNPDGHWEAVADPFSTAMRPSEAFWVYCKGGSEYAGPLALSLDAGYALDFADILTERSITLRNNGDEPRTVLVTRVGSGSPTDATSPANLGPVPLGYMDPTIPIEERSWLSLPETLAFSLEARSQVTLRLEVRRREMAPVVLPGGFTEGLYQDVLEFRDTQGSRLTVSVSSEGLQPQAAIAKALKNGKTPPHVRAGLWVGMAEINAVAHLQKPFVRDALIEAANDLLAQFDTLDADEDFLLSYAEALVGVEDLTRHKLEQLDLDGNEYLSTSELNRIASSSQGIGGGEGVDESYPPVPVAEAGEFQFKLIFHVDNDGTVRLLRHVTKAWRTPDRTVEGDEGEFALITNDALLQNVPVHEDGRAYFVGTNPRAGGEPVGGRVVSNAFAFDEPVLLEGGFPWQDDLGSGIIEGTVVLPYDDPLNPFAHKFNPDHDNLGVDGKPYGWQAVAADTLYQGFGSLPHADPVGFDLEEAEHGTSDLYYGMTSGLFGMIDGDVDGLLSEDELNLVASGPKDGDGIESFTVTRYLTLEFKDVDECPECSEIATVPGWGDSLLAGTYSEEIRGIHKLLGPVIEPEDQVGIQISGTFVLKRISPIGELTDDV